MSDFGTNLKRLRAAKGLTVYRLAQLSGVTEQNIAKLEEGGNPKLTTLVKLAAGLGVPVAELIPAAKPARKSKAAGKGVTSTPPA